MLGRRTILGTIHEIAAEDFPSVIPSMYVYAAITDGRGEISIIARIVDADEGREPVWESMVEVEFEDPHAIEEVEFEITDAEFFAEGRYRLQLLAGDAIIMERNLMVQQTDDFEG